MLAILSLLGLIQKLRVSQLMHWYDIGDGGRIWLLPITEEGRRIIPNWNEGVRERASVCSSLNEFVR